MILQKLALSLFTALLISPSAYADFVDNFDTENNGEPELSVTSLTNFNITVGWVDLLGPDLFNFYPGNGFFLDLNGSEDTSGTIESKSVFAAGQYELSFKIGNNNGAAGENFVTVNFGTLSETFSREGEVPLDTITRAVTLNSASTLEFATPASDSDKGGIILDSISVTAVPEPSSFVFGLACLAGLVVRSRK